MKKLIITIILTIFNISLMALPKAIQLDKYIYNAKNSIKQGEFNYIDAYNYYQQAIKLNIKLPDDFYFDYAKCIVELRGVTLGEYSSLKEAKEAVDKYLTMLGKKGKYYEEALKLYAKIEQSEILEKMCNNKSRKCKKLTDFLKSSSINSKDKYCDLGFSEACDLLSKIFYDSELYSKFAESAERSCKLNSSIGCYAMSMVYAPGHDYGKKKDNSIFSKYGSKVFDIAKRFCEKNDNISETCLTAHYYSEFSGYSKTQNVKYINKVINFHKKLCEKNDKEACFDVAYSYLLKSDIVNPYSTS